MASCTTATKHASNTKSPRNDRPARRTAWRNDPTIRHCRRAHQFRIAHGSTDAPRRANDPTCADSGAQVLPPARATVPLWLPSKSARVSSLLACYALGPPACVVPCSCRRWLPLGRACLSVWIEHRSGERRSPQSGPQGAPARAQSVPMSPASPHQSRRLPFHLEAGDGAEQ